MANLDELKAQMEEVGDILAQGEAPLDELASLIGAWISAIEDIQLRKEEEPAWKATVRTAVSMAQAFKLNLPCSARPGYTSMVSLDAQRRSPPPIIIRRAPER